MARRGRRETSETGPASPRPIFDDPSVLSVVGSDTGKKEIPRIQNVVKEELKRRAVNRVASRLDLESRRAGGGPSEFGRALVDSIFISPRRRVESLGFASHFQIRSNYHYPPHRVKLVLLQASRFRQTTACGRAPHVNRDCL